MVALVGLAPETVNVIFPVVGLPIAFFNVAVVVSEPGNNIGQTVGGLNTILGMPMLIITGAEVTEEDKPGPSATAVKV
jgi:hypothetical protein